MAIVTLLVAAALAPPSASAVAEAPVGRLVPAVGRDAPALPSARPAVHPPMTGTLEAAPIIVPEWRWPLLGRITQRFGESLTVYGYHQGIDIDGQTGDPVVAAHAGRVVVAGDIGGCGGRQVQVDIGAGIVTIYHHFSAVEVSVGQVVTAGARIGRVGETGCAFGSHLHFAVEVHGTYVDPLRYLPPRS